MRVTKTYEFGQFGTRNANRLDGLIVTLTTHPDEEKPSIPAGTYGPYMLRYVTGRQYLMLCAPDSPVDVLDVVHNVFLADVATVEY